MKQPKSVQDFTTIICKVEANLMSDIFCAKGVFKLYLSVLESNQRATSLLPESPQRMPSGSRVCYICPGLKVADLPLSDSKKTYYFSIPLKQTNKNS